jgi:putative flippase GtrA
MCPTLRPKLGSLAKQFVSFTGVGAVGTAVHYAILVSLVSGLGFDAVLSSAAGALGGAVTNYRLNYYVTFKSRQRHRTVLWRFVAVATAGLGLNTAMMALLVGHLAAHYLPAQVATHGIVLTFGFAANRFWTFREDIDDPS